MTDTDTAETDTLVATSYVQVESPLLTTVITYEYDGLHRLTEAAYSGSITATFSYEYDALGNRTLFTKTITSTEVTTYTYNAGNQLVTAESNASTDIWYYEYDGNGNLVRQVPNGLTPAAGEVRYTYNQRNQLARIERHDGNEYLVEAEVAYDGDGRRLRTVAYVAGVPLTTTYTLDIRNGSTPLVLSDGASSTYILYGLFGLGEAEGTAWHYYLGDAALSVRQLVGDGDVLMSRTYGPFGNVLEQAGSGSPVFGFAASLDGGSGLLYINGRYFDPRTGRFLSPDNENFDPRRPGTLNGYLLALFLANPGGVLFGLLLMLGRRKRGGGRGSTTTLLILGVLLTIGMVSCQEDEATTPVPPQPIPPPPTPPITPPSPPETPTSTSTPPPSPPPPGTATEPPIVVCPTPSGSPTPTPSGTPLFQPTSISQQGLEFVAQFESIRLNLYNDPAGHCTVGIGHLVHLGSCSGDPSEAPYEGGITVEEAYDLFRSDIIVYEEAVHQSIRVPLSQEEFDALVSLAFNIGPTGFANSRVAAVLNEGDRERTATVWLTQSITAVGGSEPLPGLIRRREFEATLFREGIYRMDW